MSDRVGKSVHKPPEQGIKSLERRGADGGSKELDWSKIPSVFALNSFGIKEISSDFTVWMSDDQEWLMRVHAMTPAFYESIMMHGRKAGLLPVADKTLRRPTRDGHCGGFSWLAANAVADMFGSPRDPFHLCDIRHICKKSRQKVQAKLKSLQSCPFQVMQAFALVHNPHWEAVTDVRHFISPEDLESFAKSLAEMNAETIDQLSDWTLLEDLFNRLAAHGADPSGANYNEEMKNQTLVGKSLLMAIGVVKSMLAVSEGICQGLWQQWSDNIKEHLDRVPTVNHDPNALYLMNLVSKVCNRVPLRESVPSHFPGGPESITVFTRVRRINLPFALCLLELEQAIELHSPLKSLVPDALRHVIYELADVIDLITSLNRLLRVGHHVFEAVHGDLESKDIENHFRHRRSKAVTDFYLQALKRHTERCLINDIPTKLFQGIWRTVQRRVTQHYRCNLIDVFDLDVELEHQIPSGRLAMEWDGDYYWKEPAAWSSVNQAQATTEVKRTDPDTSEEQSAVSPDGASSALATMSLDGLPPPLQDALGPAAVDTLQHQSSLMNSTSYVQSGHPFRKANGLLDKSPLSTKSSPSNTNKPTVERRAPPAVQETSSKHPVYKVNNRQLKLMHVLLEEPEPGSGDGGEIRWEALVQVFKRIGFTVTANNGFSHCFRSPDSDRCFFVNKPRPKPVLEKTRVKELREKLQDLYGWNTDWFTSAGSRRDWEEED